jgi:YrbI family 3-deoxy-D-manno-octulosonate 8-phosphate phosphatase
MKYIFFDIDGVMTDGRKSYGEDGVPFAKTFFDKDFTGLKIAVAAGFKVVAVSGDERVNKKVMINRNIDFIYARSVNKWEAVTKCYKINKKDLVVAVGDDIFDLELLQNSSIPCCPINSHPDIIKYVQATNNGIVTKSKGGEGVLIEIVYDLINKNKLIIDFITFYELDQKEKF